MEFCHYETWASLFCHPAKGIRSFVTTKLDTLAKMPFVYFVANYFLFFIFATSFLSRFSPEPYLPFDPPFVECVRRSSTRRCRSPPPPLPRCREPFTELRAEVSIPPVPYRPLSRSRSRRRARRGYVAEPTGLAASSAAAGYPPPRIATLSSPRRQDARTRALSSPSVRRRRHAAARLRAPTAANGAPPADPAVAQPNPPRAPVSSSRGRDRRPRAIALARRVL